MKKLFIYGLFSLTFFSCKKNEKCTDATVTLHVGSCKGVGVIIKKITYPTNDLPGIYAIDEKNICIEYSLYYDPKMCMCCGGTYAHIIQVH